MKMSYVLIGAAALVASNAAVAQEAAPADAAAPAPEAAPAPAEAVPPPAAATTGAVPAEVTAKVQADWSKYDKDGRGSLTALEFGSWILAARGQDMTAQVEKSRTGKQANLIAVKVLNATAGEFVKADRDRSNGISPDELAAYLAS